MRSVKQAIYTSIVIAPWLFSPAAEAATFCVSTATEFQQALYTAEANAEDDVVKLVQGEYHGHFSYIGFTHDLINISGGYTANCTKQLASRKATVLDGDHLDYVLYVSSEGGGNIKLSNLTVQNGNPIAGSYPPLSFSVIIIDYFGVYYSLVLFSNPVRGNIAVINVAVVTNDAGNSGYGFGAGISGNNITIDTSLFGSNSGGGLYSHSRLGTRILNSRFQGNKNGGAVIYAKNLTFTNNKVIGNHVANSYRVSGIDIWGSGSAIVNNNIIANNTGYKSDFNPAVTGIRSDFNNLTLTNNTIIGSKIASNKSQVLSIYLTDNASKARIYNNLIWGNQGNFEAIRIRNDADSDGIKAPVLMFNNDFDKSKLEPDVPFVINASNLNKVDPQFADALVGDYHLKATSPVIGKGNNKAPGLPAKDMDGDPRIIGPQVDIGADEYKP